MTERKSALRKEMLAARAAMGVDVRAAADAEIFRRLTALPAYLDARTVFLYVSVGDEPDTRALIEDALARGKRVCVPLCERMGVMRACRITGEADLVHGKYGIPEPAPDCPTVPSDEIDLIVAPCVCCDRGGYRLGYGGGFYDRWLAMASAPSVVLCYAALLVDAVPREPHDRRADLVVTDAGIVTI
ncbi:MAG: 5-formyltetrahydrofolate cyclo-ligase [Clostridiales Family XIII bacterium]|jgi:5-formyltetrahydrofolate cyclo-ligase|nr:5-formyltetrahydrofolate cyclo-ligase [Clostridiales Family XIII bacterium]